MKVIMWLLAEGRNSGHWGRAGPDRPLLPPDPPSRGDAV